MPTHFTLFLEEVEEIFVLHVQGKGLQPVRRLNMEHGFADSLADGHAAFIQNLSVLNPIGTELEVTGGGKNGWSVVGEDLTLPSTWNYTVALTHENDFPISMRDEIPHRTFSYSFWTGRAIFIYPETADTSFTVSIEGDTPISTVWEESAETPRLFLVRNRQELVQTILIFGDHKAYHWQEMDSTICLTVQGAWREQTNTLVEAITAILHCIREVFGGIPASRLLVAVETVSDSVLRGGVIGDCVSICLPFLADKTESLRPVWGTFLSHELFHLWQAGSTALFPIQDGQPDYWFIEGFTTYYQDVLVARLGWISSGQYREKCEQSWEKYKQQSSSVSLDDASRDKGRYSALIYDGGRIFALLLCQKIREQTDNVADLDTLMRALFVRFGSTGTPFSQIELIEVAASVAEMPLSEMEAWFHSRLRQTDGMVEVEFRQALQKQ